MEDPFSRGIRMANAANRKRLIVIFQRGGNDGLNTVIPYGDDAYYSLRPNLAIDPPDGFGSNRAISIDDDLFALHPSLSGLSAIYANGDMSILPTVHYDSAPRSHFVSEETIEKGGVNAGTDGWLNRLLSTLVVSGGIPAVSVGTRLPCSMRGDFGVPVIYEGNPLGILDDQLLGSIESVYAQDVDNDGGNRSLVHKQGMLVFQNMDTLGNIDINGYIPENGAIYPTTDFGQQMKQVALLLKEELELQIVTLDSVGWDTHSGQGRSQGMHADALADLGDSIAALYRDLGPLGMQDTLIVTMTEFGRTAQENASGGTDHGHASAWFAIGGSVQGGIYGSWPGLAGSDLFEGRYLDHTIDFRDVLSEIIVQHLGQGVKLSQIIPGHVYQPVGFL